jgi:hypothetical protein
MARGFAMNLKDAAAGSGGLEQQQESASAIALGARITFHAQRDASQRSAVEPEDASRHGRRTIRPCERR